MESKSHAKKKAHHYVNFHSLKWAYVILKSTDGECAHKTTRFGLLFVRMRRKKKVNKCYMRNRKMEKKALEEC